MFFFGFYHLVNFLPRLFLHWPVVVSNLALFILTDLVFF